MLPTRSKVPKELFEGLQWNLVYDFQRKDTNDFGHDVIFHIVSQWGWTLFFFFVNLFKKTVIKFGTPIPVPLGINSINFLNYKLNWARFLKQEM